MAEIESEMLDKDVTCKELRGLVTDQDPSRRNVLMGLSFSNNGIGVGFSVPSSPS